MNWIIGYVIVIALALVIGAVAGYIRNRNKAHDGK